MNILRPQAAKRLGDVVVRVEGYEKEFDETVLLATPIGLPEMEEPIRIRLDPGASKKAVKFEAFAARRGNDATGPGGLIMCEGLLLDPNGTATTRWPKVFSKDVDLHPVHIGGYGRIGLYYKRNSGDVARDDKGNVKGFIEYLDVAKAEPAADRARLHALLAFTVESNEAAEEPRRGALVTLSIPGDDGPTMGRRRHLMKFDKAAQCAESYEAFAHRVMADLDQQLVSIGGVDGAFGRGATAEVVPVSHFPVIGKTAESLTKAVAGERAPKMPLDEFETERHSNGRISTGYRQVAVCNGCFEPDAEANRPAYQYAYRIFKLGRNYGAPLDIDQVPTALAPEGLQSAVESAAETERHATQDVATTAVPDRTPAPAQRTPAAERPDPSRMEKQRYGEPDTEPTADEDMAFLAEVMDEIDLS
ncbi:hypothetical protein [Amorphus sp. 3PC139-8]|uniref:hypothetical protein n=1 Tax=Amorphus sp. 3PC139-8 TaxID=2735676 RepID=UPI00345CC83D